jgi:uncharacterized protein YsxB (DUF464 family)
MITAEFISKSDRFVGFKVFGHADYGEYGQDIVCASVSSAVQLVCNTITECFSVGANVSVDEQDGIALTLDDISNGSPANTVIDGLRLHLSVLSEEFPKRINVKITEV